jgi:hypothetical protein
VAHNSPAYLHWLPSGWDADDLTDSPTAYFLVRLRVAN